MCLAVLSLCLSLVPVCVQGVRTTSVIPNTLWGHGQAAPLSGCQLWQLHHFLTHLPDVLEGNKRERLQWHHWFPSAGGIPLISTLVFCVLNNTGDFKLQ